MQIRRFLLVSGFLLLMSACTALRTAPFDQYSYQKAVEIKVDASRLMDKASTPYQDNVDEVEELLVAVEKMVVYEQNKPNNGISYEMWRFISDEEKNSLAGFFKEWKETGQFSDVFLQQAKPQIVAAMDILIQYEGKKDKESENSLRNIILGNQ
ncbi:MAG: hypothetical protein AAF717_15910 [Bacteroidota bacterium]